MSSWYRLLPFQMDRMQSGHYLCSSIAGDHVILQRETLCSVIDGTLPREHQDAQDLMAGLFLSTDGGHAEVDLLATRLRTRLHERRSLASLHIVVATLRCANACGYCQVSRVHPEARGKDLSDDNADRTADLIMSCPSSRIKVEFQGGEALLNMPVVQRIVERCDAAAAFSGKLVSYVIATSLSHLTDANLDFFAARQVHISTSLDGPQWLHDRNRPSPTGSGWLTTVAGIERCRRRLGHDCVSALMTTARTSLAHADAIVDQYQELGFHSIFLRWLNPFGDAVRHRQRLSYTALEWLTFWQRALDRVLSWNDRGYPMREEFTCLLLRRMLSPHPAGFVDLDSPTGSGTSVLVYNYDGSIYVSDEGRMLAEIGDQTFRLGHVQTHTYAQIMDNPTLRNMVSATMLETTPRCDRCACLPWCGVDPVVNHATQGDIRGCRPTSDHCQRMEGAFHYVVGLLRGPHRDLLLSWAAG